MLFRCRCVTKMRICIDTAGGRKDLVFNNPNIRMLNEYKAYVCRNYDGAKGQDLFERSYLNGRINTGTAFFHLYCVVSQDQGEGFRHYEMLLCDHLRDMGVNYVEDDYEEQEKMTEEAEAIDNKLKEIKEEKKKKT